MAIEDVSNYLGPAGETPFDLLTARRDVLDYHRIYGMPAIIKRAYNSDHVAYGEGPHGEEVERDETWDDAYGQGFYDPNSVVADGSNKTGYSEGWFTYITLDDAPIDTQDPGERGSFKRFITNGIMPWIPNIWDGDLIILVEINRIDANNIKIIGTEDRFILQNVVPVTMRGGLFVPIQEKEANFILDKDRFISQKFQAVRMPRYNNVYDIPVI